MTWLYRLIVYVYGVSALQSCYFEMSAKSRIKIFVNTTLEYIGVTTLISSN